MCLLDGPVTGLPWKVAEGYMELLNMSIYNKTNIVKFWSRITHFRLILAANIVSPTDVELPRTKCG